MSDFDSFLKQKGLAAMDLYRAPQSGVWGPKSKAAHAKGLEWWNAQNGSGATGATREPEAPVIGAMPQRLVAMASREVGVKEEGGNNRGARIVEYQKATWLDPGAWPWCAAFVCWSIQEALRGYQVPQDFDRPRTAGAWDFERWARENAGSKAELIKPAKTIRAGDIVCFTFSHIGIATHDPSNGTVKTVEGNTGPSGGREGDGVWAKTRPVRKIRSAIRLNF